GPSTAMIEMLDNLPLSRSLAVLGLTGPHARRAFCATRPIIRLTPWSLDLSCAPELRNKHKLSDSRTAITEGAFKSVTAAITWNVHNVKSKQISLEVSARIPPSEIATDLRACLNVIGSTYNAHLAGTLGRGFFSNHTGIFELEYPGAKKVVLGLRSSNSKSNDRIILKGALEATLPNVKEYRIEIDNRLTDVDSRKLTFAAQSDIKFFTPAFRDGLFHVELGSKINTAGSRTTIGRCTFSVPRLGHNIDGKLNLLVSSDSYKLVAT
ncbi:hypothetical protein QYM36_002783, partial [Artemia franciscana]